MTDIHLIGLFSRLNSFQPNRGNRAIMHPMMNRLVGNPVNATVSTNIPLSDDFCAEYGVTKQSSNRVLPHGDDFRSILHSALDVVRAKAYQKIKNHTDIELDLLISNERLHRYSESDIILSFNGDAFPHNGYWPYVTKHALDVLAACQFDGEVIEFAGSPGPYTSTFERMIAQTVFENVDKITNREPVSTRYIEELDVDTPVYDLACPAFLLEPCSGGQVQQILEDECIPSDDSQLIGITLSGFNIPRKRTWSAIPNKEEVELFTPAIKYLLSTTEAHLVLLPHSYDLTSEGDIRAESEDYQTLNQIYHNKSLREFQDRLTLINGVYSAPELKGVIGEFDMYLSGRLHAGAAGYSQEVPTALLAYGHKHYGFAELYKQEDYVIDGQSDDEILGLVQKVWQNRGEIEYQLSKQHPSIKELAERNFELLAEL